MKEIDKIRIRQWNQDNPYIQMKNLENAQPGYRVHTVNDDHHLYELPLETQNIILDWVFWNFYPAQKIYPHLTSDDLKEVLYKRTQIHLYNNQFKEAISAEQLHEDAMKSSPRVMAPEVSSIGALIDEMYQKNILMLTPDERELLQETLQESSEMPTFFVVTNTERIDGAGVIFYPEFMDNMGELLGNDFFILPSSIHEMLVLPDDGQVDAEMLRDMVKEVNATQVAPAERLTNDVYHFDTKDHVFEKADRFTERQKEKEAQAAKTEKAGKEQPDQKPKTKKHDMEL